MQYRSDQGPFANLVQYGECFALIIDGTDAYLDDILE